MSVMSRCFDIVVANINGLLDRVESPEAMIGQIIREMDDGLAAARRCAAGAIAAERRLGRELAEQRLAAEFWQTKARIAMSANREDLARLALIRKKEHEALAIELETQHAAALQTSKQVRAGLQSLEARLAEARRKQRSLIARHRAAQVRQELSRMAGGRLGTGLTAGAKLQRWEERLTDLEDEIAAQTEVQGMTGPEATFSNWEAEVEFDRELTALKEGNAKN
jgi:phage shock protein A